MLNTKDEDGLSGSSELYAAGSDTLWFVFCIGLIKINGAFQGSCGILFLSLWGQVIVNPMAVTVREFSCNSLFGSEWPSLRE